jgi:hypothetical protein
LPNDHHLDGLELVVALACELQQAKAVAEGIVQQREATVSVLTRRSLENGAGSQRSSKRYVEVRDDEIEVERGPVSGVAALLFRSCERRRPRRF